MISRHSANRRWLCVLLVCGVGTSSTLASDSEPDSDGAKARMTEMTSMIDGVRIDVDVDGKLQAAKREPKALLRTIDISRKNSGKEDGSLWLWSHDGMPVAMVELWAMNDSHNWGHTMLAVCQRELRGRAAHLDSSTSERYPIQKGTQGRQTSWTTIRAKESDAEYRSSLQDKHRRPWSE